MIELKLLHHSLENTLIEGLAQTWTHMDRCGADAGHLVILDRDPNRLRDAKIFTHVERYQGVATQVWGMVCQLHT